MAHFDLSHRRDCLPDSCRDWEAAGGRGHLPVVLFQSVQQRPQLL